MFKEDFNKEINVLEKNYGNEFDNVVVNWVWERCVSCTANEFHVICEWVLENVRFMPKIGDFAKALRVYNIKDEKPMSERSELWHEITYYNGLPDLIQGEDVNFTGGKLLGYQKRMFMDGIRPLELDTGTHYNEWDLPMLFEVCRKLPKNRWLKMAEYFKQEKITDVTQIIKQVVKVIRKELMPNMT